MLGLLGQLEPSWSNSCQTVGLATGWSKVFMFQLHKLSPILMVHKSIGRALGDSIMGAITSRKRSPHKQGSKYEPTHLLGKIEFADEVTGWLDQWESAGIA